MQKKHPPITPPRATKTKKTSWGHVASWYDTMLADTESYQRKVILPNLLRLLDIKKGTRMIDIACGQGFFTHEFAEKGARITGTDISPELIAIAKKNTSKEADFLVSPADTLSFAPDNSIDVITIILAIQNINPIHTVFRECFRALRAEGTLNIVMNHPAFRIPKSSDWQFDDGANIQYRRISRYLSESNTEIDMHPGDTKNHIKTISFHRPLQAYVKNLSNAGFVIDRLEEWASHKKSGRGPRQTAENNARKEIPLFLFLRAKKNTPHK
ncbi:MAG: methyltransferase domain-containing protein [Candidatus Lloydbacteria bacterium]|nr:methyltransferase domain-containing protein [Candidatus Lloydbacteria bacterium]